MNSLALWYCDRCRNASVLVSVCRTIAMEVAKMKVIWRYFLSLVAIFRVLFGRFILSLLLILAALTLIAANPLQIGPEDPSDFLGVLQWLALGPGALFVAGSGLAFLLELFPAWGSAISGQLRPWIVLVLTIILAFGAKFALTYPTIIEQIAPVYTTLFLIVAAWVGSQFGYARAKIAGMRADRTISG
jgi:hypothetical protein